MVIVIQGYLNQFVTPESEGGKGVCEFIVGLMTTNQTYNLNQVYSATSNLHPDEDVKALTRTQVSTIMKWMAGKTFNGKAIGNNAAQIITYAQPVV